MGKDEHRRRKNNPLAQTPKNQLKNDMDAEFSKEFAEATGHEEKVRERMKTQQKNDL